MASNQFEQHTEAITECIMFASVRRDFSFSPFIFNGELKRQGI